MAEKKTKHVEIKTKANTASVEDFINAIEDEKKREDSRILIGMMKRATGEDPQMWGSSLIGFGKQLFRSPKTGREVDWFILGFSPRKANLSLHLGVDIRVHADALLRLGKHKTGAGCLYINKLTDVDLSVLEKMIKTAAKVK
mgnify:CR=1 FL=1